MKKTTVKTCIFVFSVLMALAAFGNNKSWSQEKYTIKIATVVPETHYLSEYAKELGKVWTEKGSGRIKVEYYFNSQLGNDKEMLEQLQTGALEAKIDTTAPMEFFAPRIAVADLPYLFRDYDQVHRNFEGRFGDKLAKYFLDTTGIRVVTWLDHAFRQTFTARQKVGSLKDMKGLKIRVPGIPSYVETFKNLGAAPTSIPFGEAYSAIQTGVVDGFENDWLSTFESKFYEVIKFAAMDNHVYLEAALLMNNAFYQKLPQDLRKMIEVTAPDVTKAHNAKVISKQAAAQSGLVGKGLEITKPDLTEYKAAVKGMTESFKEKHKLGEFLDLIE